MTWLNVADWINGKRCHDSRKNGTCNHLTGRPGHQYNPCDREAELAEACEALAVGKPTTITPEEIYQWGLSQTCHASRSGHGCSHQGCIRGEALLQWIKTKPAAKVA